jgi:hypothetical protein
MILFVFLMIGYDSGVRVCVSRLEGREAVAKP